MYTLAAFALGTVLGYLYRDRRGGPEGQSLADHALKYLQERKAQQEKDNAIKELLK